LTRHQQLSYWPFLTLTVSFIRASLSRPLDCGLCYWPPCVLRVYGDRIVPEYIAPAIVCRVCYVIFGVFSCLTRDSPFFPVPSLPPFPELELFMLRLSWFFVDSVPVVFVFLSPPSFFAISPLHAPFHSCESFTLVRCLCLFFYSRVCPISNMKAPEIPQELHCRFSFLNGPSFHSSHDNLFLASASLSCPPPALGFPPTEPSEVFFRSTVSGTPDS